jgi:cell division septal protein FtsQ
MKIKRSTLLLWKTIAIRALVAMVVAVSIYGYFLTNFFVVTNYTMTGVPDEYRDIIQRKARESEGKKQFFIIPSDKVLTYNVGALRSAVVQVLPNTKTVSIHPVGLHTMSVTVSTFVPLFRIDDTYAITKDGVVYKETRDTSSLPTFTVASSTTRAVGELCLTY